jgi:hypothetical protein
MRDRARGVPEHAGINRHATWVAAPKRRLVLAIPACMSPLLREDRGHPVSSREDLLSVEVLSVSSPRDLEDAGVFAIT